MIRLIASDMDGTLLSPDGSVCRENVQAISEALSKGMHVIVCTGRCKYDAFGPLRSAGLFLPVLCMNGAVGYLSDGTRFSENLLSPGKSRQVLLLAERYGLIPVVMGEGGDLTTLSREEFIRRFAESSLLPVFDKDTEQLAEHFRFRSIEEITDGSEQIYKITLISERTEEGISAISRVRKELSQTGAYRISSSDVNNIEITDASVDKGAALSAYCGEIGIELSEVAAIGDSENDLSMFCLPLGKRIAMENGVAVLKEKADEITRSNRDAGVAFAIHQMLINCCERS